MAVVPSTRTIGSISSNYYNSGTGETNAYTITFTLYTSITSNATNNTSTTSMYIRATRSGTAAPVKVSSWAITGNGGTKSGGETSWSSVYPRNFGTASKVLTNGLSGGGTFSSGATVTVNYYSALGSGNKELTTTLTLANRSYEVPTVDVYSKIAFSTTSPTMGNTVTMTFTKAACATSGVRVQATYDDTTTTIYEGNDNSYTWTVPDLSSTTTTSSSKQITIAIQSKKNTTYYAAKNYTIDAQVPASYVPSVTIGTVTDNIGWSSFVQNYSKLTVPLTGATTGGATIVSYAIEIRDTNSSGALIYSATASSTSASQSFTSTEAVRSASTYVKATITDSRGRTGTATRTVSAVAYNQPQISLTAQRCDSDGTSNPLGAYVKVTVTWSITQIGTNNSVTENVVVYKSTNGTSYSSAKSQAVSGYSGSFNFTTSLATTSTGYFYATIKDNLSARVQSNIKMTPKATLPLSLYDNGSSVGVSIGQMASGSGLNVYLPAYHSEQIHTSFKSSVAMGSYGTSNTTLSGFMNEVRFSSGCTGSISLGTAVTSNGVTIPTGWYNFIYSPHRTGGNNGAAVGDNCNYGSLLLMGMTSNTRIFKVRASGSSPYYNSIVELSTDVKASTRTDTYYLGGLMGIATSSTNLRVQIPIPSGYSNITVATDGTVDVAYNGALTTLTPSAVSVTDINPSSVMVGLTVSGLTSNRQYGVRSGKITITLS